KADGHFELTRGDGRPRRKPCGDEGVENDRASTGEVGREAVIEDAVEGAFERRSHAAEKESVRSRRRDVIEVASSVEVQYAAKLRNVGIVGRTDAEPFRSRLDDSGRCRTCLLRLF